MGSRKFYYGDMVKVVGARYQQHLGHTGVVTKTRIKQSAELNYEIQCECGLELLPTASQLAEPLSDGTSRDNFLNMEDVWETARRLRAFYFLNLISIPLPVGSNVWSNIWNKVLLALSMVGDRQQIVIQKRHGLGELGRSESYKSIGESLGVTSERARQIHYAAIRKLRKLRITLGGKQ